MRHSNKNGWSLVTYGGHVVHVKPHARGMYIKNSWGPAIADQRFTWHKVPVFPDVLVLRAVELGLQPGEYDSVRDLELGIIKAERCRACNGEGELFMPAEMRGGVPIGPDSRVCSECGGSGKSS